MYAEFKDLASPTQKLPNILIKVYILILAQIQLDHKPGMFHYV